MASAYQVETAPLILPHLGRAAQKRATLTYGELAHVIGQHHRPIAGVLGYIRDDICCPRGLPLINVIVVNQETRLPGIEFLPEGTMGLTEEEYKQKFEAHRDEVFAYAGWNDLLEELGLTPIRKTSEDLNEEGREYSKLLGRRGASGEGEAHALLKNHVAANPDILGLGTRKKGKTEFLFVSGDRCDVVFDLGQEWVVVEVKDGQHDGELVRGIYQVIKYRALMMAEKGQGEECPVSAFLVAHKMPDHIAQFGSRFDIDCRQVNQQ